MLVLGDGAFALGVPPPWSAVRVAESASTGISFWNATLPHTGPQESEHLLRTLGAGLRPDAVVVGSSGPVSSADSGIGCGASLG